RARAWARARARGQGVKGARGKGGKGPRPEPSKARMMFAVRATRTYTRTATPRPDTPLPHAPVTDATPAAPPLVLIRDADRPMQRLFGYLTRWRGLLWFSVVSSILNKVLDLMPPLLVAWVIDSISKRPPAFIVSMVGTTDAWTLAVFLAVLAVLVHVGESVFEWMWQLGFRTLAQRAQHELRVSAWERVQQREMEFFEEHRTGETLAMLNDDVNQLERFLNTGFNELLQLGVLFIFSAVVLVGTCWQLSLISMIPIPLIILGSLWYQRLITPRYRAVRQQVGELSSRLENNLGGMLVIKSFTAEDYELQRVTEASGKYRDANQRAITLQSLYVPCIRMGVAMGFAGVLLVGSYQVLTDSGMISVGNLVLFSMLTQRLLWPLTRLGSTLDEYERARASARRTFGLLDTPPALQDPAEPTAFELTHTALVRREDVDSGNGKRGAHRGSRIEFDNVHFQYRRGVPVLRGLDFVIEPGEMVGVAGTTGAGKSTLIKLLLRLYDVTGGAIRVDGVDVREARMTALRQRIALVSQDVYLFHGTIQENIAYGTPDAPLERVIEASRLARLDHFVETLPEGYRTVVGERGIRLSGGQRQRLSIARAILKNAPVLVLDEATSSVDTETEREIQQNLARIAAGRTALVIAHRLSTIRHADRIIVLRDGRVAEVGSHDSLVAMGGTYADLWHIQSGDLPVESR
ncbi:MAG: ABC transporter ATP-binding protein, partial [Planctomycetota bacterium]